MGSALCVHFTVRVVPPVCIFGFVFVSGTIIVRLFVIRIVIYNVIRIIIVSIIVYLLYLTRLG